ncbi:MAG TPA: glycosyltransferase family 39 protein, partial [Bryobacteraceae bacterium]
NRVPVDTILMAGRAATILLAALFGAAIAWWTRRRYGDGAGLLAVALCCFDPNLMAHGRYVTTDFPVTVFYFFTCVLWIDYLETNRARLLSAAAVTFALALVTKFSAVLLIPTLPVLYVAAWIRNPREFPLRRLAVAGGALAAAVFVIVNIVYWPETLRCLRQHPGPLAPAVDRNDFVGSALYFFGSKLHLPAHRFFLGLNALAEHNAGGHASYLLGLRSDTGWWYYFPVVFAVKSTIAALIATVIALALGIRARMFGLLFPPVLYFVVSMTSGINIGVRHILPVYPFLYVAAAAALARLPLRRAAAFAMLGLGVLQIGEFASISPDYLAFFNALSGGPGNGPHYLVDSNIDWGQDVKKLVHWLDTHGTRKAYVCYFGNAQLRYYGVDENGLPPALDRQGWEQVNGYVVANVTPLNGVYVPLADLASLRLREPIAKVGWSMYVYDFRKAGSTAAAPDSVLPAPRSQ